MQLVKYIYENIQSISFVYIKKLIQRDHNVLLERDKYNNTPAMIYLFQCINYNININPHILQTLIHDVNDVNHSNKTCAMIYINNSNIDMNILRIITGDKYDYNIISLDGNTIVTLYIYNNDVNINVLKYLLAHGKYNLNTITHQGLTPLMIYMYKYKYDIDDQVVMLLLHDPTIINRASTSLMIYLKYGGKNIHIIHKLNTRLLKGINTSPLMIYLLNNHVYDYNIICELAHNPNMYTPIETYIKNTSKIDKNILHVLLYNSIDEGIEFDRVRYKHVLSEILKV